MEEPTPMLIFTGLAVIGFCTMLRLQVPKSSTDELLNTQIELVTKKQKAETTADEPNLLDEEGLLSKS